MENLKKGKCVNKFLVVRKGDNLRMDFTFKSMLKTPLPIRKPRTVVLVMYKSNWYISVKLLTTPNHSNHCYVIVAAVDHSPPLQMLSDLQPLPQTLTAHGVLPNQY